MMPREFLDPLKELNQAVAALKGGYPKESQRAKVEARIAELRAMLPTVLLAQHDRIIRNGIASVAAVSGSSCGSCHMKLPVGLLADLGHPGRIAVCPHCGVFVFKETSEVGRAHGAGTAMSRRGR